MKIYEEIKFKYNLSYLSYEVFVKEFGKDGWRKPFMVTYLPETKYKFKLFKKKK